jgi:hypothetical protein
MDKATTPCLPAKMEGYVTKPHFEMITLLFKGIENLLFNFPAGAAGFDQLNHFLFAEPLVSHSAVVKPFDPLPPDSPTVQRTNGHTDTRANRLTG